MPTRRRTWAPEGHTLIIRYHDKHERISALAALTVSPKRRPMGLYVRFQPRHFQAVDVADFLRAVLRHLRGHVILWGAQGSIHQGPALTAVRNAHPRLHVEEFPAYALEFNPPEQVWNDWKGHTANSLLGDQRDLRRRLCANTRRVRRSHATLRSFIRSSKLPSPP
jgi:hypothetical protein